MPFSVKIRWGSETYREEADSVSEYEFDSQQELDAFLLGVEEANGYLDYEIVEGDEESPAR